jgi:hypothetical protein
MSTKAGYKTTEFWAMAATSIATILNQSGILGAIILPIETVSTIALMVAGYALSRGLAKKQ